MYDHTPTWRRVIGDQTPTWRRLIGDQTLTWRRVICSVICVVIAMPTKSAKHVGEFWARDGDGTYLHLRWEDAFGYRTTNHSGTTGWCNILRCGGASWETGTWNKFHKCAHNPCTAMWTDSKHGKWLPSTHVQPVAEDMFLKAVLPEPEPPIAPDPTYPVAPEPAISPEPVAPEPVIAPEPAITPEPVIAPEPVAPEPDVTESPEPAVAETPDPNTLPPPPVSAPLKSGVCVPAAVHIDPQPLSVHVPVMEPGSDVADPVAAKIDVFKAIMTLSREICMPQAYVGYSFFMLLALSRKCPLLIWEGDYSVNLLEAFAPWALDTVTHMPEAHGVATALVHLPSGTTRLHHVCEEYPLSSCRHFIASKTIDVLIMVSRGGVVLWGEAPP